MRRRDRQYGGAGDIALLLSAVAALVVWLVRAVTTKPTVFSDVYCNAITSTAAGGVLIERGLRLRIGVDYGRAMVRLVPRSGRLDYVGRPMNRAARIAAKAKAASVSAREGWGWGWRAGRVWADMYLRRSCPTSRLMCAPYLGSPHEEAIAYTCNPMWPCGFRCS